MSGASSLPLYNTADTNSGWCLTSHNYCPLSLDTAAEPPRPKRYKSGAPAANAAANPKYKTEFCKHFLQFGTCDYGWKCTFIHPDDTWMRVFDAQPMPAANGAAALMSPLGISSPFAYNSRYKTEYCRNFTKAGTCQYGPQCQFIHPGESISATDMGVGGLPLPSFPQHLKYKTEVCRYFSQEGKCPYGPQCQFIHPGEDIEGTVVHHPKYKSVLCRNFALDGQCSYGDKCTFIHRETTEEEREQLKNTTTRTAAAVDESEVANGAEKGEQEKPHHGDTKFTTPTTTEPSTSNSNGQLNHQPSQKPKAQQKQRQQSKNANHQWRSQLPCRHLMTTGRCVYGAKCQFSHGFPPTPMPPAAAMLTASAGYPTFYNTDIVGVPPPPPSTSHPKYKTEPCRNLALTGKCDYGEKCTFIHPSPHSAPSQPTMMVQPSASASGAYFGNTAATSTTMHLHAKYKKVACRYYAQYGYCVNGTNCPYIHGDEQLQQGASGGPY